MPAQSTTERGRLDANNETRSVRALPPGTDDAKKRSWTLGNQNQSSTTCTARDGSPPGSGQSYAGTDDGLLEFDRSTCLFQLGLHLLRLGLRHTLLQRRRSAFHQLLGVHQGCARNVLDHFHDIQLLVAETGQHDIEFGLFRYRGRGHRPSLASAPPSSRHHRRPVRCRTSLSSNH